MIKTRLLLPVLAAAAAIALLAGCGSDDSSSSTDPASVAPADTPVFIEAKVQPTGELKTNLEGLAKNLAGIDDLGGTVVSYLEQMASDSDEPIDFDEDIQPWLGESAGIFLSEYNGDDFEGTGFAIAVTDTGEAQDFLDKQIANEDSGESEDASYEGVDYQLDTEDEEAVGIVGSFIVFGDDEASFKAAVDASDGDSLAEADSYTTIRPSSPQSSFADVYVNIGGLVEAAKSEIDPQALKFFEAAGVQVEKSSALISLVPGSNNIEIDVASKLTDEVEGAVPSTDAAQILGSMPADSFAAISAGDLGASISSVVDTIDEEGIPGEVPAGKFKSTLKEAGIDLDRITGNLGDAAVFAQGTSLLTLSGAIVIEAKDPTEAKNTVANSGTLLRARRTPGVTVVKGEAAGFSVRSEDLGRQPLVVAAKGERIAIGYGLPATLAGLDSESDATLSETKAYNEALNALGSTPITGFAAGRPALRLVEGLLTDTEDKEELEELAPYLSKVPFLAIGAETKEDVARARLILGVTK
jgi:hypothetical protein